MPPLSRSSILFIVPALFAFLLSQSDAGERRFTFGYEALTSPKGAIEYEQWVTWKALRGPGGHANEWDFRHELEFGITEHFQLGLYLSDWTIHSSNSHSESAWNNAAAEVIYNLSNPTTDFLGSALYGEVKLGDELFALEGKLILQKTFGPLTLLYNTSIEAEWEGSGYEERVGEWQNVLGISYEITPSFLVGAELLHEVEFEDWSRQGDHVLYAGPNASWRFGNAYATATVLFQATDIDEEPDVQTRLIFGFRF